jgi:hypothetical protein
LAASVGFKSFTDFLAKLLQVIIKVPIAVTFSIITDSIETLTTLLEIVNALIDGDFSTAADLISEILADLILFPIKPILIVIDMILGTSLVDWFEENVVTPLKNLFGEMFGGSTPDSSLPGPNGLFPLDSDIGITYSPLGPILGEPVGLNWWQENISNPWKQFLIDIDFPGAVKTKGGGTKSVPTTGFVPSEKIKAFASGGFPEDGFFFANSSELVGKFDNGKTAVANNKSIESGIEAAVTRGLMPLLAGIAGISSNDKEIVFNVDGQKMNTALKKASDRSGRDGGNQIDFA